MNYEELIKKNRLIKISMMISDRNVSKNEKFANWLHSKVNGEFTLREKAILIKNGFAELPLCLYCGSNPVKFQIKGPYLSDTCLDSECCKKHSNEKRKKTSIEKYGTSHPTQSSIVKENFKKKSLKKWGVDNPAKADEIRIKIGNTVMENKMATFIKNSPNLEIIEKEKDSVTYKIKCKSCGHEQIEQRQLIRIYAKSSKIICEKCNPSIQIKTSILEDSISNFISLHYKGKLIKNYNGFDFTKKEADIYIPDLSLAIDINGLYWHSELFKENKYHINKKIEFEKAGIKFIHLWEDDLLNPIKREIVNSRLLNLFGVNTKLYARKLDISFSKYQKEFRDFLDKNHLQGYVNASEYYCLRNKDGVLISLMSFKYSKGSWELMRFCTVKGYTVIGGGSKLLKVFLKNHSDKKLFSYADLDWSSTNVNNVYDLIGFKRDRITTPGYFWVRRGTRFSRNSFMKNKIQHLLLTHDESETDCLHRLGYYRVYNSGNLYYEMHK